MSAKQRRSRLPEAPAAPSGYRQTRRGSKAAKTAKKAEQQHKVATVVNRTLTGARNVLWAVLVVAGWILGIVIALLLVATIVNTAARWNAERNAGDKQDAASARAARENLVVIGVDSNDSATGLLALRFDRENNQVFGVAIPDGAFIDVPGQGFAKVGDSYLDGPAVSTAAVSNFLGVAFTNYLVVPTEVYKAALTDQSVAAIPQSATAHNLPQGELAALSNELAQVPKKNVALVPMPVKPIKLGDQTYFEPQRAEIADLLKSWWGVDVTDADQTTRVIVYNGSGTPGIAGQAAQQLICEGLRVVDTKNADRFDYATTKIVVRRGDESKGEEVRKVLGVGEVSVDPSESDVTDVIIIVGKDYKPPAGE